MALTAVLALVAVAATVAGLLVANRNAAGIAQPVDLDTLPITPQGVQSLLKQDYMAPTVRSDRPTDIELLPEVTPADCHTAMYLVPEDIREPGAYVAMRSLQVFAAGERFPPNVAQIVVEFASGAVATRFFDDVAGSWRGCQDEDVTSENLGYRETNRFDGYASESGVVTMNRHVAEAQAGFECQNALGVKLNFAVVVRACSFDLADQARQVVTTITSRITA